MSGRRKREKKQSAVTESRRAGWNWTLSLLLAAAFTVKAIALAQLQHHPLLEPGGGVDSAEYVALAQRVLGGDLLLGPGLYYLSPLYVYFLAALHGVSGSFTFVRVCQIALGTAAVWCVYLSARAWFGERAGVIAGALAALTGVFTFYEIVVFQSSIDVFLTAAGLACLAIPNPVASAFRRNTGAGFLFGLQFLNRPNIAIGIAGVLIALLIARRWRGAIWLTAGAAIAVTPLVVRNAIVTHGFALTSSQGGLNFYIGNHAGASGQYAAVPGVRANMAGQAEDTRKVAESAVGHPMTDAEVSSYFTGLAFTWIREHPADAAALFARKLALTFNARHQWLDFSYPYYAYDTGSILQWLFVGPWLLVPLGFCGAALLLTGSPRSSGSGVHWLSFVPAYAIGVAIFFVAERYRLPLLVPLCVLSGGAADRLLQAIPRPSSVLPSPFPAAIALGVAGAIVAAWPFQLEDGRYEERLRLSKALMNRREFSAAAAELEHALLIRPADPTAEFHLGMAQLSEGRVEEGLAHVRRAVDAGVAIPGARYALVNAMLATGDRDGAVALLATYQPAPEDSPESCLHVAQLALAAGAPRVAARYAERALQLRPGWREALQLSQELAR